MSETAAIDVIFIEGDSFAVDMGESAKQKEYSGPYKVTPLENEQTLPTKGCTLSDDVTVDAIPPSYHDTSDADAVESDLKEGKVAYNVGGRMVGTGNLFDTSDATATEDKIVRGLTAYGPFGQMIGTGDLADVSGVTALAPDVAAGKFFVDALGVLTEGTASTASVEVETGTWTTGTRVARPTIPFVNTHEKCPAILYFGDATDEYNSRSNINYDFLYVDIEQVLGSPLWVSSSAKAYGYCFYQFRLNNSSNLSNSNTRLTYSSSDPTDTNGAYPRYWVKPGSFQPWSYMDSRYWNIDRTYKWTAIWL